MRRMLLALPALPLALALASPAGAEPIGFMASTHGDVSHAPAGGATWQAAQRDAEVEIGDGIRTGVDSQAKILLVDDTLFQIDEETELRIETWHVGAAATRERSIVRQLRGRLRTTVGEAFGGSTRLQLEIPTAAIGIKGTDLETRQRLGVWEACTISGGITVTNDFGIGEPPPGSCVGVPADGPPTQPYSNPLPPLAVNGNGGKPGIDTSDFTQKIEVDVAADEDEGGPGPPGPNGGNGGVGYDSSGDKNNEDELVPSLDVPEIGPIEVDPDPQIPLG